MKILDKNRSVALFMIISDCVSRNLVVSVGGIDRSGKDVFSSVPGHR